MTRFLLQGTFAFVLAVLTVAGPSVTPARAADPAPSSSNAVLAPSIELAALDPANGFFVTSHNTATVGPHGIPNRKFIVARAPDAGRFHDGWTYTKDSDGKKDGLQVYRSGTYLSFEHFRHGQKIATAEYRDGKPSGWFHQYAPASGHKHGFQYYFSDSYASLELFNDGHKTYTGEYRSGIPSGWFHSYDNEDKKSGTQRYVSGDYWSFEQFSAGVKSGLAGEYRKDLKNGWFCLYDGGNVTSKAYFSAGKVTDSTNGDRVLGTLSGGIPPAWRIPDDRTSAAGSVATSPDQHAAGGSPNTNNAPVQPGYTGASQDPRPSAGNSGLTVTRCPER